MAVTCTGVDNYDPRTTIKGTAAEAIDIGESCRISSDGKAYVVDNAKSDVCHGWALTTVAINEKVTLFTKGRMMVGTAQTIGARLYTGNIAGGSAPSTTLAAVGVVVGFAIEAYKVFVLTPIPAANG